MVSTIRYEGAIYWGENHVLALITHTGIRWYQRKTQKYVKEKRGTYFQRCLSLQEIAHRGHDHRDWEERCSCVKT